MIVTGKDMATAKGEKSYIDWMLKQSAERYHKGMIRYPFTGKVAVRKSVKARVDFGRWIADCPDCNGAEYVNPGDPFYCLSCGNVTLEGFGREVIFPKDMEQIGAELMNRPVNDLVGANDIDRALKAKSIYPGLSRSWNPGETVTDLKKQLKEAKHGL
jgi:hypothetical protein